MAGKLTARERAHDLCKAIVPACVCVTDDGAWEHSRFCNATTDALQAHEDAVREEALAQAVAAIAGERLEDPVPGSEGDVAYSNAVADCEEAVSAIRSKATTEGTGR